MSSQLSGCSDFSVTVSFVFAVKFDGCGYGIEVIGVEVNEPTIPECMSPDPYEDNAGGPKYEANWGLIDGVGS